jgi:regulation of enolase protein 1 (concanavalin A-like superfamily)
MPLDPEKAAWLRLARRGNDVAGFVRRDPEDWKALEPKSVELSRKLKIGVYAVNASEAAFSPNFPQWKMVGLGDGPDSGT